MSNLKNMKFKVSNAEHSRNVQQALFEAGYGWNRTNKEVRNEAAKHLFTSECGSITYEMGDAVYFEDHAHTEYVLCNGEFVTAADYFKQPATAASIVEPQENVLTPRQQHEAQRTQAILEAMLHFSQAGKAIPS